jgi:hypothetical protein
VTEKGSRKFANWEWRFAIEKVVQIGVDKRKKVSADFRPGTIP